MINESYGVQRKPQEKVEYCHVDRRMIFGHSESIMSYDTYQFPDYSKVVATRWDEREKDKRRREIFPKDCPKVYDMGVELVKKSPHI